MFCTLRSVHRAIPTVAMMPTRTVLSGGVFGGLDAPPPGKSAEGAARTELHTPLVIIGSG